MTQNISNFFRGSFTPNSYEKSLRKFTHEGSQSTIISNIARAILYYLAILPAILLDLLMKPRSFSQSFFKNRIVHTLTEAFYKKRVYDHRKILIASYSMMVTGIFFSIFSLSVPAPRLEQSQSFFLHIPFHHIPFVVCNLITLVEASTFGENAKRAAAQSQGAASSAALDATRSVNASNTSVNASTGALHAEINATGSALAASASATSARTSATSARTSETSASRSEINAITSEINASRSETSARTSETSARTSEINATGSAESAKTAQRVTEYLLAQRIEREGIAGNEQVDRLASNLLPAIAPGTIKRRRSF